MSIYASVSFRSSSSSNFYVLYWKTYSDIYLFATPLKHSMCIARDKSWFGVQMSRKDYWVERGMCTQLWKYRLIFSFTYPMLVSITVSLRIQWLVAEIHSNYRTRLVYEVFVDILAVAVVSYSSIDDTNSIFMRRELN